MENVLSFLADNYLYFMIGAVVLLFALIGFAVDGKKRKKDDVAETNPANTMPNTNMQFGQNPNAGQNNVPNQVPPTQPELSNGMTTGFDQFATTTSVPEQAAAMPEPTVSELQGNTNSNEELTFGPILSDNNESIFTEPPVVDNTNNETLTFEMPSTEPAMEALDLGTPVSAEPSEPSPVSMTPEVPTQNEVPAPTPVQQEQAPEMPSLNNTLQ